MKRMAKVALVGAAVLVLLLGATPAQAAPRDAAFVFAGNATLAPGLAAPVPFNFGSNGTWTLTSLIGAGTVYPPGSAGITTINVSGSLHAGAAQQVVASSVAPLAYLGSGGFCGASGGSRGAGTVTIGGRYPAVVNVSNVLWVQSAGSLIVYQGDTNAGRNYLSGVASATPNITAGSCLSGTAVSFVVVGTGTAFFNG